MQPSLVSAPDEHDQREAGQHDISRRVGDEHGLGRPGAGGRREDDRERQSPAHEQHRPGHDDRGQQHALPFRSGSHGCGKEDQRGSRREQSQQVEGVGERGYGLGEEHIGLEQPEELAHQPGGTRGRHQPPGRSGATTRPASGPAARHRHRESDQDRDRVAEGFLRTVGEPGNHEDDGEGAHDEGEERHTEREAQISPAVQPTAEQLQAPALARHLRGPFGYARK